MENASKALLMAGGVLIAIIIISLLVKTFGSMGELQRQQVSAEEVEKIEAFNKEYTKYLDQYVYGTEVITIINKAASSESNIDVYVNNVIVGTSYITDDLKRKPFKCTEVNYGNDGKVNCIKFEEKTFS